MGQVDNYTHFYLHGIDRLLEEVKQFHKEDELWKVTGDVSNSAGNLTLHLIGNLNHFIGAQIGKTGYVRDRDNEFVSRDVHRDVLLRMIAETKTMLEKSFSVVKEEELDKIYPLNSFGEGKSNAFVLSMLLNHLNYHLGQINYLRRFFSPTAL